MQAIYSIVGYSGSGKTTLLEKLIATMKDRGLRVAIWKHDAHEFDIDHEGTDSARFTAAGADITLLASANKLAILENRPVDRQRILDYIHDVDIIFSEGYTHGNWRKIGIRRTAADKELSLDPSECIAIVSDVPIDSCVPVLDINDHLKIADFILNDMANFTPSAD